MIQHYWPIAALVLALSPSAAQADWLFAPSATYPFAGDRLGGTAPALVFGVGWLDEESVGFEAEVGYLPRFFDDAVGFTGVGSVFSLMGNLMITGSSPGRVMPYFTGGAGLLRMQVKYGITRPGEEPVIIRLPMSENTLPTPVKPTASSK